MDRALRAVCSHAWREVHSANTRIANACPPLPAQVLLGSSASATSRRRCQWGPCAGALCPPDEGLVEAARRAQCSVSVHIMCRCLQPCIGVRTNAPEPLTCMRSTCSDEPRLWQRKSTGLWRRKPEAWTWVVLGEGLHAELPEEGAGRFACLGFCSASIAQLHTTGSGCWMQCHGAACFCRV